MKQSAEAQVIKPRRWCWTQKWPHCHQDPGNGKDLGLLFISVASPWVMNGWILGLGWAHRGESRMWGPKSSLLQAGVIKSTPGHWMGSLPWVLRPLVAHAGMSLVAPMKRRLLCPCPTGRTWLHTSLVSSSWAPPCSSCKIRGATILSAFRFLLERSPLS